MQSNITKLALDIGNSKIKAVLGELNTESLKLRVLDYVEGPTQGLRKNVVENSDILSNAIRSVITKLEDRVGMEFERVSIGISSDRIQSKTDHGQIEFEEKEIDENDVRTLINSVKSEIIEEDEQVIEEEIYNIRVDNSGIIKNPVGQIGNNLQGDVHLVTVKDRFIKLLVQSVNKAGYEVEDIFLSASASAKATLEYEERAMGVALIDIGEGVTDIAIYKNDKIIYTKSLSVGGANYVSDISYLQKVSNDEAREILERFKTKQYTNEAITINDRTHSVEKIREIIDARTGDVISFIAKTIEESGFNGYLGKGLTFTGGAVAIDEIYSKVGSKLEYAVRKVNPTPIRGLEEPTTSMATVIGILLKKLEQEYYNQMTQESFQERVDIEEEQQLENQQQDHISEEVVSEENESIVTMIEEKDIFFQESEFDEELEEEKTGVAGKLKRWMSNFI